MGSEEKREEEGFGDRARTTEAAETMLGASHPPADDWLCPIPRALTRCSKLTEFGWL